LTPAPSPQGSRFTPIYIGVALLTGCAWNARFYDPIGTGLATNNIYGRCNFHRISKGMDFKLSGGAVVEIVAEMPNAARRSSLLTVRLSLGPQQTGGFTGREVLVSTDGERSPLSLPMMLDVGGDITLPFPKPINFTVTVPDLVIDGRIVNVGPVRFEVRRETEFCDLLG
jgi:hypothetical protein